MPITPVSFEEDDNQETDEYDDVVDEVVDEEASVEAAPTVTNIDSRMAEMEERLEMIQYYKLLLNGGFFNNPPNPAVAAKIEQEVADHILTRLDALLNMGAVSKPQSSVSQFTEEEVSALKELASPNTHKILTEVVSRVFSKIDKNEQKKPAKTEAPKLSAKTVPQETVQKKPAPAAPMTVKAKTPAQPKAQAPAAPKPAPPQAPQAAPVAPTQPKPGRQKKQYKTHVTDEGKEVKMDITPQARPLGAIQPVAPAQSKFEMESRMEMSSKRSSNMGLNIFDQKLNK